MAQVGLVKEISGTVQAVSQDGSIRVLVLGDVINEGEVINTVGNDSGVKISFNDGKELELGGDEKSLMDESVVSSESFSDGDVAAIQQALLSGEALPDEATAVGQDSPDGTGGITEAYTAQRGDARGDVNSYNLGKGSQDGSIRVLVLGDVINEGEVINTVGNDSGVKISFNDGRKELELGGDEKSLMDESVVSSESFSDGDVAAIQQALLSGEALPDEATAVGQDSPDGTGGITEAYTAQRGDARGDVNSYNLGTSRDAIGNPEEDRTDTSTPVTDAMSDKNEAVTTAEDTEKSGNVMDNLSDSDSDSHSVTSFTVNGITYEVGKTATTKAGTITIAADGSYTFTPAENFHGDMPQVTYSMVDNNDATDKDTSTLDIEVTPVTDAMSDKNEAVTTAEDTEKSGNVMDNLSDSDSDSHSVTSFTVNGITYEVGKTATTKAGTITIAADGSYTFTPAENFHGDMPQVTYSMVDNNDATDKDTSTLDIEVTPVTDAMSDKNEAVTTAEDTEKSGNVMDNLSDSDSDSHSVTSFTVNGITYEVGKTATTKAGTITIAADGSYTFTPAENFHGDMPQVTYSMVDNNDATDKDTSTLDIEVTPVTDAMSDKNEAVTTAEDTEKSGNVMDNLSDSDSDSHSVTSFTVNGITYEVGKTATTKAGTITIAADGSYTFTPAENFHGDMPQVTYSMVDNNDATDKDTSTLDIEVTPVADAPELSMSIDSGTQNMMTQTITVDNVSDTDKGFKISAKNAEDTSSTVSKVGDSSNSGFGVDGSTSGSAADTEIGYVDGKGSEKLIVEFENDVSSIKVSFAWQNSGEEASYVFYKDGVEVGRGTRFGVTDLVDDAIKLAPENGSSFDKVVFTAVGHDDDYLIHSIEFTRVKSYTYELDIKAILVDDDGSEKLSDITFNNLPKDTQLYADGVLVNVNLDANGDSDGSYTVALTAKLTLVSSHEINENALKGIVTSVTSTEQNNLDLPNDTADDSATTTLVHGDIEGGIIDMDSGNDKLFIGGDIKGNAQINMGDGNDTVEFKGIADVGDTQGRIENGSSIDFGDGEDTLIYDSETTTLNLQNIDNLEHIILKANTVNAPLTVSVEDVFGATTDGNHTLTIKGEGTVNLETDDENGNAVWTETSNDGSVSVFEATYHGETVLLHIENDIANIM